MSPRSAARNTRRYDEHPISFRPQVNSTRPSFTVITRHGGVRAVSDFMHEDPNVLCRVSIGARPFPSAIEHSSMEFMKIRFGVGLWF